jgi:hypothetical protein
MANLTIEILMKSGAIKRCPTCREFLILVGDKDAEEVAHRLAISAWKAKESGFRGLARTELAASLNRALVGAPSRCPSCEMG